ncbi:MAG TPA: hypothetical protein VK660_01455 [Xanthomonadaceae bacterium]|jgi:hypothetical protein|nr:hypothetical protein [Xanthomonadaceae bacterium]
MEPNFEAQIFLDPDRIELHLKRQFDLSVGELRSIAASIYRGFAQVSSLHPKGFNGTNAWAEGISQLRATLIPKGWRQDDPQGQPRIVSKNREISITVSSGNSDTGVPNRVPQTRNDKGSQTATSVQFNARQGVLFQMITADTAPVVVQKLKDEALWIFLYYIDFDAGQMRFELSQPTNMSDADKINGWSIRYILPPLPLDPILDESKPEDSPDIDFEVTPKVQ